VALKILNEMVAAESSLLDVFYEAEVSSTTKADGDHTRAAAITLVDGRTFSATACEFNISPLSFCSLAEGVLCLLYYCVGSFIFGLLSLNRMLPINFQAHSCHGVAQPCSFRSSWTQVMKAT
jgi:hypothetical protein